MTGKKAKRSVRSDLRNWTDTATGEEPLDKCRHTLLFFQQDKRKKKQKGRYVMANLHERYGERFLKQVQGIVFVKNLDGVLNGYQFIRANTFCNA